MQAKNDHVALSSSAQKVFWPCDVQVRYNISLTTRWRWEQQGKLPGRDVRIGARTGWRIETLIAAEGAV